MRSPDHVRVRISIWIQTLAVVAIYAVAICLVHMGLLGSAIRSPALSIVLAFTIVQVTAIGLLLAGLIATKHVTAVRERGVQRWIPMIRERMIAHILGDDARVDLRELFVRSPAAVERCAEDLLAAISGSELERMSELVQELNLVDRWRDRSRRGGIEFRRRAIANLARLTLPRVNTILREALTDPEDSIRLEASRALLRADGMDDVERIFELATRDTLFLRAILVEDLRPHALTLSEQAIPRVLGSGPPEQARVALEIIEAWQKSLPVPDVGALLRHPRAELRAQALRVLPYASADVDIAREIALALEDENTEVQIAALGVAGRLGLVAVVPALGRQLRHADRRVAVAAAYALADIGPQGWTTLESVIREGDADAAPPALEALERVRTNRLHLARV